MGSFNLRNLLRDPVLHFLLAGGVLFAVYTWIDQGRESEPGLVRISAAEVNWLRETWTRQWTREPDQQELRGLVAGYLREQLLAREARELGLEQDDTVVRRRLAQKMEFILQDTASLAEPEEAVLSKLYDSNRSLYQTPAKVSFTQLFFRSESAAGEALDRLITEESEDLGERSLLAREHAQADQQTLSSLFGPDFAMAVFTLETGHWQGPVASAYGFHLVRVSEHLSAQPLPFEQVRERLAAQWRQDQRVQAKQRYLAALLEKYEVVMDEEAAALIGPLSGILP